MSVHCGETDWFHTRYQDHQITAFIYYFNNVTLNKMSWSPVTNLPCLVSPSEIHPLTRFIVLVKLSFKRHLSWSCSGGKWDLFPSLPLQWMLEAHPDLSMWSSWGSNGTMPLCGNWQYSRDKWCCYYSHFFTERVLKHLNSEAVESPSLGVFRSCVDVALKIMFNGWLGCVRLT